MSALASADPLEIPDFAEAIVGWRVWRVVLEKEGYRLGSVVKRTVWPPGEPLLAECLRSWTFVARLRRKRSACGPVPEEDCECGIYAGRLPLIAHYLRDPPANPAVGRVLGTVSLWGSVIECERGFRASHAYPLRVYVPVDSSLHSRHRWEELVSGLDCYGIPVEPLPARCSEAVELLEHRAIAS